MTTFHKLLLLLVMILLAACQSANTAVTDTEVPLTGVAAPTLLPTPSDPGVIAPRETPDLAKLPLLAAYFDRVQAALQQPVPILKLDEGLDDNQKQAQDIAVADPQFQGYSHDTNTQAPLRSEIFGVYPLRESDITEITAACRTHTCYRVEMYNFALNLYLAAIVDLDTQQVIDRIGIQNSQPDIPPQLVKIAIEIASNSPDVLRHLGGTPEASQALMANTKTALNGTYCERSRHLCVAPTFVVGDYALWAIVDLTEGVVVGTRWTVVGDSADVTEKKLQNESLMRLYCQSNTSLERDGWRLDYILTSSDGLRISDVSYQGTLVLDNAKLVDWHVSYSREDGFGYSDAVGCPVFSQAAVIAVEPPKVEDIVDGGQTVGFALIQDFWSELWPNPCNYYYEQRYEFYEDGRFRPVVTNMGRGCGNDGTYRPVTRLALAGNNIFSEWDGSAWLDWPDENWRLADDVSANDKGYAFRVSNSAGDGYYIVPGSGQFGDGGRGDHPYIYVTQHHLDRDEGDSDLPTLGPCCNQDYHQGPERFIDPTPEPIVEKPLVFWYVAQIKNDDTPGQEYCWAESVVENGIYTPKAYPCPSGPMFVPISLSTAGSTP